MVMSALAQATRLRIVVLLAAAGRDGMSSGDIADCIGVPRNLMSSHLALLSRAGVVGSQKTGRSVVYSVLPDRLLDVCAFLNALAA